MSEQDQFNQKREDLLTAWQAAGLSPELLSELPIHSLGPGGLRDRVDLTLFREADGMCLGLYDMENKHILPMTNCPMMTPALSRWFQDFRTRIPDIQLGGLRLRVAPDGARGLWLDFPNLEIQRFLQEGTWLTQMMALAHVEMGQRRLEVLSSEDGSLVLGAAKPLPWFETWLGEDELPCALYCGVGGFTQVGFAANRALVRLVRANARATGATRWLELGSGIGNFTLPLAAEGWQVTALENDPRANSGLQRSAVEAGLGEAIQVVQANMHRQDDALAGLLTQVDAVLADPPRSGLRGFCQVLANMPAVQRPRHFVYVSCFGASLAEDVARLIEMGYRLESAEGLDQFPQSRHCEWLLRLRHT